MKSISGLPKLVQHLADNVVVFGIEVESPVNVNHILKTY